jgi:succinyl-CoA synthetase beta subunit
MVHGSGSLKIVDIYYENDLTLIEINMMSCNEAKPKIAYADDLIINKKIYI